MIKADWRDLALKTVTDPAWAGRQIVDLQIPLPVLILGFLLAPVLNAILLFGPAMMLGQALPLPLFLDTPVAYVVAAAGGLAATIAAVFWVGRSMGGKGTGEAVAAAIIWLQLIRDLVQVGLLILQFLFPLVSIVLAIVAAFYSIYVLLHFINAAHELGSLGRSAGVLAASLVVLVMGLTVLMAVLGGLFGDPSSHV
ncbi:MAG: Yip1 family protein [Marinibacterium sp.]